jgi:hypothetical protein
MVVSAVLVLLGLSGLGQASSCAFAPCGEQWSGVAEFAQTHVVRQNDTRITPKPVADRAMELLFTPSDYAPPHSAQVQL